MKIRPNKSSFTQKKLHTQPYVCTYTYVCVCVYKPGGAAEFIEFATTGEDNKSNFSITQNRELVCLFEESIPSLGKGHLPIYLVFNSLQLHPPSSHYYIYLYVYCFYVIGVLIDTFYYYLRDSSAILVLILVHLTTPHMPN